MKQPISTTIEDVSSPKNRMPGALLFLLLAILLSAPTHAQEMTVKSLALDPSDVTANLSENLIQDNNGDYAGLVKVNLASANAEFEGLVLKSMPHGAGEYWVFMAKDSYRLRIRVPGCLPLDINFRNHGIEGVEPRRTYMLTITLPQMGAVQQDDGMRYLAMTVEPKNSKVLVDEKEQLVENGEMVVNLPRGTHTYEVSATGYATEKGTVQLDDAKKTLEISLKSVMTSLRVECATPGAQVYVNGQLRGAAPWVGAFLEGTYKVEARLEGYRAQVQNVTLGKSEQRTVSLPALGMIVGSIDVKVSPVNAEVYIDGKKVGTTPDVFRNIQVGSRSVEIRKQGYEPLKKTVTVTENGQASITGALNAGNASSPSSSKEVFTVKGVSFTMIRVDGGTFTMGATNEQGSDAEGDEKPVHDVTLSTFSIGETEVTQALWKAVMGNNPSIFDDNPDKPVEKVSWEDCQKFIVKLNKLTGKTFRLPTEAEWEYAARGGSKTRHYKYSGSNDIDSVAWWTNNSGSRTHAVKTKMPNELGLYDMSGNVYEWCADWYENYANSRQTNPTGPAGGSSRVRRGGSWDLSARRCRVSYRDYNTPDFRSGYLGLRLAL